MSIKIFKIIQSIKEIYCNALFGIAAFVLASFLKNYIKYGHCLSENMIKFIDKPENILYIVLFALIYTISYAIFEYYKLQGK